MGGTSSAWVFQYNLVQKPGGHHVISFRTFRPRNGASESRAVKRPELDLMLLTILLVTIQLFSHITEASASFRDRNEFFLKNTENSRCCSTMRSAEPTPVCPLTLLLQSRSYPVKAPVVSSLNQNLSHQFQQRSCRKTTPSPFVGTALLDLLNFRNDTRDSLRTFVTIPACTKQLP